MTIHGRSAEGSGQPAGHTPPRWSLLLSHHLPLAWSAHVLCPPHSPSSPEDRPRRGEDPGPQGGLCPLVSHLDVDCYVSRVVGAAVIVGPCVTQQLSLHPDAPRVHQSWTRGRQTESSSCVSGQRGAERVSLGQSGLELRLAHSPSLPGPSVQPPGTEREEAVRTGLAYTPAGWGW